MQGTQELADCGDFLVYDDYDATVGVTNFYDNAGNVTALHMAINGTDTYRQSVTGETITRGMCIVRVFFPKKHLYS